MKNCLLLISLLWLSFSGQAQEQKVREVKPIQAKPITTTKTQSGPPSHHTASADTLAGETIEHCNSMVQAIDNKVEYVKSDQNQHEKALATGWYDKMAR